MWTYRQSTGELLYGGHPVLMDGKPVRGYSGDKLHKNDPAAEDRIFAGPIPRGRYTIGHSFTSTTKGPVVMDLAPAHGQEMHHRGGFLIHGDSKTDPGGASHGCIILARHVRDAIDASPDRDLEVIQ